MENDNTYSAYDKSIPWSEMMGSLTFGIVATLFIVGIVLLMARKSTKEQKFLTLGIVGFFSLMMFSFPSVMIYHEVNETRHLATLNENLSKKYEFNSMIWEKECSGAKNCSKIYQSEEQEVILSTGGVATTYNLTQDKETHEPFLTDPFTGQEPKAILK